MKMGKRAKLRYFCRVRYFTMVEMLAVIAIILVLAGLTIGAYKGIQNSRAKSITEGNLAAIQGALEAFKTKHGYYPQTLDGKGSSIQIAVIVCKGFAATGKQSPPPSSKYISTASNLIFGADFYQFLPTSLIKSATTDGEENNQDVLIISDGYKTGAQYPANIKPSANIPVIYYRCPGVFNPASYDLFAAGPDRKYHPTTIDHADNKDNIWPQNLKKASNTK